MGVSKVVYGGNTLIDLTGDTITPDKMLSGTTAHGKDGEPLVGSCGYDVDSGDATIQASEMLEGKTGYARGAKLAGEMKNNGAVNGIISTKSEKYTIPQGYHDGSGTAQISAAEQSKIVPGNIKAGVSILGQVGTYAGDSVENPQSKTVTPSKTDQIITPDTALGYTCLSQVTVKAVPYVESPNSAGGTTVTIG